MSENNPMANLMTQAEREELIDLYVDDALPDALRGFAEAYLAAHPEAAAEAAALQAAVSRLKSASSDRPDTWFMERALDRLLREHAEAQETGQDTETRYSETRDSRRI